MWLCAMRIKPFLYEKGGSLCRESPFALQDGLEPTTP